MVCRAEEETFFKESATNAYTSFRNKAAESRSMAVSRVISTPHGSSSANPGILNPGRGKDSCFE